MRYPGRHRLQLKPLRLCALDLDGTLVDTKVDIAAHVNRTLQRLGFPVLPLSQVLRHVGLGARSLWQGVAPQLQGPALEQALGEYECSYLGQPVEHSVLYPGALELLAQMKAAHVAVAVVTNKPHAVAVAILERLGVLDALVCVEGGRVGVPHKPDPALLARAAQQAGALAGEMVMVGDSAVDFHTAAALGCSFLGVDHGMDDGAGLRALGVPLCANLHAVAALLHPRLGRTP